MSTSPSLPPRLLRRDEQPSDLTLERYLIGELSASEVQILEEMLTRSPELSRRVDSMRRFDAERVAQLKAPPYLLEAARQRDHNLQGASAEHQPTWGQRLNSLLNSGWGWAAIGAVVIAALIPMLDPYLSGDTPDQDPTDLRSLYSQNSHHGVTRAKGGHGGIVWEVYRASEADQPTSRSVLLKEGDVIYPGQRIGFRLYPKQLGYYMIIGRDSTQKWYLGAPHLRDMMSPERQLTQEVPALAQGVASIDLTEALEFDDQLGREELFLIFCTKPSSYGALKEALSAQYKTQKAEPQSPIKLPDQCILSTISLEKRAR